MSIQKNIEIVREKIAKAVVKSNRNLEEVTLIGVSKTVEIPQIIESFKYNIEDIGENKPQEILDKYDQLKSYNKKIHFIGHLQTNKIKYIIDKVNLIHSIDRYSLIEALDKKLKTENKFMDVLIQINIAKEETKGGFYIEELDDVIEFIRKYQNIKVKGFMVMAPYTENPEEVRWVFKEAKILLDKYKNINCDWADFEELSMGMSNDFEIAIEEGATLIRVGSAIYGERDY